MDFIAASVSTETDRNTYQPILAEGDEKARIEAKVQEAATASRLQPRSGSRRSRR
ncbi:MAG: hypothetical protein ACLSDQ_04940 [Adlercreutzia equolifaciens]